MRSLAVAVVGVSLCVVALHAEAQTPLGYVQARGSTVTPAYEGWYENPDGTITLSWGYYNRNSEEELEIPLGPDNFMEPGEFDGWQPTRFTPSRQWGAFGVVVPGAYDGPPVRWTLNIRGKTFMIPSNLAAEWKIDALVGDADGNLPPELAFQGNGPWFAGPGGAFAQLQAKPRTPTPISVWARDDGDMASSARSSGRRAVPVTLTWLMHSGPGEVTFDLDEESARIPVTGGMMTAVATFTEPGEYIVRVRANDASGVSGAGHSQCCWSNAFFRVSVVN
jgi:hypothetical protein